MSVLETMPSPILFKQGSLNWGGGGGGLAYSAFISAFRAFECIER